MPKPRPDVWRRCRAELDLTSMQAAAHLRISGGALRAIECGSNQAVSLRLAFRAARLFSKDVEDLIEPESRDEGVPDEPPDQPPQGPTGPDRRTNGGDDKRGPSTTRRRGKPSSAVA